MTKLNDYSAQLAELEALYNKLSPLMNEVEKIDINHDGIFSYEEITLNAEQVVKSEKSKQIVDPLILDLNRNGKYTTDTENGTYFDYAGDGFAA